MLEWQKINSEDWIARMIYVRNPQRGEAVEEWLMAGMLRPADSSTFERLADEAHYVDTRGLWPGTRSPMTMAPIGYKMGVFMADPPVWTAIVESVTTAGAMAIAVGVALVESRRADQANKERDALLAEQTAERHRGTAKLVSAWIEQGFVSVDDSGYIQYARAYIVNGSTDPVFNVQACVWLETSMPEGPQPISLGALSIPRFIKVLPPNRTLEFDLTSPLLPHRRSEAGLAPDVPSIELLFTDPNDVHWARELDGRLVQREKRRAELLPSTDNEAAERQLGRMDEANPIAVVFMFLNILRDEDLSEPEMMDQIRNALSTEAVGWQSTTYSDFISFREELTDFSVASNVAYPVPTVAYVKLVLTDFPDQLAYSSGGEGLIFSGKIVTLNFSGVLGWRIFSYGGGGTEPDHIYPPGSMD
jgi:hypothetical protein